MFPAGLTTSTENRPLFWASYILGTLVNLTSRGTADHVANWASHAGATDLFFAAPNDPLLSGASIVRDETEAVLAFQGTRTSRQALMEVMFSPQTFFAGIPGRVHGFFGANTLDRLQAMNATLDTLPQGFPLSFTGHSLGGAIAQIAATYFRQGTRFSVRSLVTFGQPRAGNPFFARAGPTTHIRWTGENDVVTGVPPNRTQSWLLIGPLASTLAGFNYMHPRAGHQLRRDGSYRRGNTYIQDDWGPLSENALLRLRNCFPACIDAHVMTTYLALLLALAQQQGSPISLQPFIDLNEEMPVDEPS